MSPQEAIVAVAKSLLAVIHAVLRSGQPYRERDAVLLERAGAAEAGSTPRTSVAPTGGGAGEVCRGCGTDAESGSERGCGTKPRRTERRRRNGCGATEAGLAEEFATRRPGELSNRKNRRSRSPFPAAAAKSAGASRDSGRGRPRISIRMHGSRPGGDIQPTPPKTETPRPNGVRERKAMPNPRREPAPGETFSRQRAEHDPAVGGMRWSTCLDRCPVDEPRHQGAREPREYALVTAQLATSAARSQPNSRLPATAHACLSRSLPIGPGVRSSQELAPETGRTRPGEF